MNPTLTTNHTSLCKQIGIWLKKRKQKALHFDQHSRGLLYCPQTLPAWLWCREVEFITPHYPSIIMIWKFGCKLA
jgi:hypothetical protein